MTDITRTQLASQYYIYIIKYVQADNFHNIYTPIGTTCLYGVDSLTFSVFQKITPKHVFGSTQPVGYTRGPTEIRGKLTLPPLHTNLFLQLHESYIREIDLDSNGNAIFSDNTNKKIELINNIDDIIINAGDINGTTSNPFDIWTFKFKENGFDAPVETATALLQCKIDTSTIIYDVMSATSNEAQFIAKSFNDDIPRGVAENIITGDIESYQKFINKVMSSHNRNGKYPSSKLFGNIQ